MQSNTELILVVTNKIVSTSTLLNKRSDGRCAVLFNDVPATSLGITKQRVHLHMSQEEKNARGLGLLMGTNL